MVAGFLGIVSPTLDLEDGRQNPCLVPRNSGENSSQAPTHAKEVEREGRKEKGKCEEMEKKKEGFRARQLGGRRGRGEELGRGKEREGNQMK